MYRTVLLFRKRTHASRGRLYAHAVHYMHPPPPPHPTHSSIPFLFIVCVPHSSPTPHTHTGTHTHDRELGPHINFSHTVVLVLIGSISGGCVVIIFHDIISIVLHIHSFTARSWSTRFSPFPPCSRAVVYWLYNRRLRMHSYSLSSSQISMTLHIYSFTAKSWSICFILFSPHVSCYCWSVLQPAVAYA